MYGYLCKYFRVVNIEMNFRIANYDGPFRIRSDIFPHRSFLPCHALPFNRSVHWPPKHISIITFCIVHLVEPLIHQLTIPSRNPPPPFSITILHRDQAPLRQLPHKFVTQIHTTDDNLHPLPINHFCFCFCFCNMVTWRDCNYTTYIWSGISVCIC